MAVARIKASGVEPWECTFVEACVEACCRRAWRKSLGLFEMVVTNSQGEARYFWWYKALVASNGRTQEAIEILDGAVRHFLRTNLATRTDLAHLQTMAGRFREAEGILADSLELVSVNNPLIVYSLAVLFEAQDRLEEALTPIMRMYDTANAVMTDSHKTLVATFLAGELQPSMAPFLPAIMAPIFRCHRHLVGLLKYYHRRAE
jgi:tetratricopeptide (TPR) repeat protein